MGECIIVERVSFAPNQALPPGYVVDLERDYEGTSYRWSLERGWDVLAVSDPHPDRWSARREAMAHFQSMEGE